MRILLAKRTYKNQVTIPKAVMKAFPDVEYFDVVSRSNVIILRPVDTKPVGARLATIRAKVKALGLTETDVEAAIRWVRRK